MDAVGIHGRIVAISTAVENFMGTRTYIDVRMVILKIGVKLVGAKGCKVCLNVWLGLEALQSSSRIRLTRHSDLNGN